MSREHIADAGDAAVFAADHGEPLQCEERPGTVSQQVLGRVFKISFTAPNAPQPVAIGPASETRTVVAFDRPIDATAWRDAARLTRIEAGRAVGPADRDLRLRPLPVRHSRGSRRRDPHGAEG